MVGQRTNDVARHEPGSGCPSLLQPRHGTHVAPHEPVVDWPRGATDGGDAVGVPTETAEGGTASHVQDTTALVLSRAVHLVDAAVQHLQACLEQDPAGDTTDQVRDIIGALHEVQALAEGLEVARPARRT